VFNLTPWLPYPLKRRLGRPHNQTGHIGGQKNPLPLPGFKLSSTQPLV